LGIGSVDNKNQLCKVPFKKLRPDAELYPGYSAFHGYFYLWTGPTSHDKDDGLYFCGGNFENLAGLDGGEKIINKAVKIIDSNDEKLKGGIK
jgi:hypothetical protein